MKTDYDYYLLGCRYNEVVPLSRWRFTVAYAKYRQMLMWKGDDWRGVAPSSRGRIVARWNRLRRLDDLIRQGKALRPAAARADYSTDGDTDTGTTGAGDREPRVPLTPVLAGCGARPLPRRHEFFATLRL